MRRPLVPSRLEPRVERQIAALMARRADQARAVSSAEPATRAPGDDGDEHGAGRALFIARLLESVR